MVNDALGMNVTCDEPQDFDADELPNEKEKNFYQLLKERNIPLFEGSSDSRLSMCVRLLTAKSNWNILDHCLGFFAKMMLDASPMKENMPTSYYDTKRMMSKLRLEVKKIDSCIGGCMLFYDNGFGTNDGGLEECIRPTHLSKRLDADRGSTRNSSKKCINGRNEENTSRDGGIIMEENIRI
ncbi:hypothetical protein KIW84_052518 [Lathyrus oleraceus]|uniref:Uncharacterized protein n=1 Tax=Pisum sativum TaxID=3888 RepID=A0A9D4WQ16_PEA|nr:hypothetical protein KIW84_052518 [Pisum sativum]